MRSVLVYTLARLALFAVTAGLLYVATPMSEMPVLLLCVSILVSGLVSYVLLSRQRDAVSSSVVRARRRFAEQNAREDDPGPGR